MIRASSSHIIIPYQLKMTVDKDTRNISFVIHHSVKYIYPSNFRIDDINFDV